MCILGCNDGLCPILKVEGIACDYYVKYGKVQECHGAPTSPTLVFPTPKNPPWHPK